MSLGNPDEAPALDRSAMKAYAHPLRVQMLRELNDHGSATATELARRLGESSGQTSYHLRQLAKHGLVEDDPDRGTGRERWWRARPFRFDASTMRDDPTMGPVTDLLLSEMVRGRTQALQRWVASDPPQEWLASSLHSQVTCLLTPDESARLGEEIMALVHEHWRRSDAAEHDAQRERIRVYVDLFPLLAGSDAAPSASGDR